MTPLRIDYSIFCYGIIESIVVLVVNSVITLAHLNFTTLSHLIKIILINNKPCLC